MSANNIIVCWEGGHSERRLQVYDQYKHKESEEEPERDIHGYTDFEYYVHQLSWIQKILECLGVHQLQVKGKEGDDVLYQAAHLLNGKKIIISEDRDFYSLISEDISIYRPIKKEYIDISNFKEVSGGYTSPIHYLYGKVLLGDGSDNIPSIAKGVGEKTILSVLNKIENPLDLSPERVIKEATLIGNSRCMKIVDAGQKVIVRNLDLVDISREKFDVFQLKSLQTELEKHIYPNISNAQKLFEVLEFNENNVKSIITKLTYMSEYPLTHLINTQYVKSVMMGGIGI